MQCVTDTHKHTNTYWGERESIAPGGGLLGQSPVRVMDEGRRLHRAGQGLTACGAASMIAAGVAGLMQAEKNFHMEHYTNTHWVTSVLLFAGLGLLRPSTSPSFFVFALVLLAAVVSAGAAIADLANLIFLSELNDKLERFYFVSRIQVNAI